MMPSTPVVPHVAPTAQTLQYWQAVSAMPLSNLVHSPGWGRLVLAAVAMHPTQVLSHQPRLVQAFQHWLAWLVVLDLSRLFSTVTFGDRTSARQTMLPSSPRGRLPSWRGRSCICKAERMTIQTG